MASSPIDDSNPSTRCHTLKLFFWFLLSSIVFLLIFFERTSAYGYNLEKPHEVSFIENKGQWDAIIKYKAEVPGGVMFITEQGLVYHFQSEKDRECLRKQTCGSVAKGHDSADSTNVLINSHAYKVHFEDAQKKIATYAEGKRGYYHNYFVGSDQSQWATGVGLFEKVMLQNVYEGIDAAIYSQGTAIKYDFIVAPGADPDQITLRFEGVDPQLTPEGNLRIKTSVNEIIEQAPYVYQWIGAEKVTIPCRYRLLKNVLTFELNSEYDPRYSVIIDPVLVFATFSGTTGNNALSFATTYDKSGNLYAGAEAPFMGWPVTLGAFQINSVGLTDVGINKYNATGTSLLYCTYYGGNHLDRVHAMITNDNEELILVGSTFSYNLPFSQGCYDSTNSGSQDIFIARFNSIGSKLLGATYIGSPGMDGVGQVNDLGTMSPMEVTLDPTGDIWVASGTNSGRFPVTNNAFQPSFGGGYSDGVLFRMSLDCSRLLYSTYVGGSSNDACFNVLMNHSGNVVICGATESKDFPVTARTFLPIAPAGQNGFASIIDRQSGGLLQSTYLGTPSLDQAFRLQVDEYDNVYVLGRSLGNYSITPGKYNIPGADLFIDKLTPTLSASLGATRIGNPQSGQRFIPSAFLYDVCGNIYVSGFNAVERLPVSLDAYTRAQDGGFWFCVLDPGFSSLRYGSYFAAGHTHDGIHRFDPYGIIYQTICSENFDFATTPQAVFPEKSNMGVDNLSFKFDFQSVISRSDFSLSPGQKDSGCVPYTLQFVNNSVAAESFTWDFGDGSPLSKQLNTAHTFVRPGQYLVSLYAHSSTSCNKVDTYSMTINVFHTELPVFELRDTLLCAYNEQFELDPHLLNPNRNQIFRWGPAKGILSDVGKSRITVNPEVNYTYHLTVIDSIPGICGFSVSDTVQVNMAPRVLYLANADTIVCEHALLPIKAKGNPSYTYFWVPSSGLSDSTILNPVVHIEEPCSYILTGSYPGCPDTSVQIRFGVQRYPKVTLGVDEVICAGKNVGLTSSVSPYRNDYLFHWTPERTNLEFSDQANASWVADTTTVFSLTVQTPAGCSGKDSLKITVIPGDFGSIMLDTGYCPPDSLVLWAGGGTSYLWEPSYGLSDATQQTPMAKPLTTTSYAVYIREGNGCLDTLHITINVWPRAVTNFPDSINLYPGERYHLETGSNCSYFQWFPPSGLSNTKVSDPWLSPEVRTRYFVTAVTEEGCMTKDSIDVLVKCTVMDMPNAFTPLSSGSNAIFKPARIGISRLKLFVIYNRWGNILFKTTDIEQGWDGTYKGEPQPLGLYVYRLEAIDDCGEEYFKDGNVTLIR